VWSCVGSWFWFELARRFRLLVRRLLRVDGCLVGWSRSCAGAGAEDLLQLLELRPRLHRDAIDCSAPTPRNITRIQV
jgi:hypothetical protein